MNYKTKYLKYKKLYLNRKNVMKGGFDSSINYNNFILARNPMEYDEIINKLNNLCILNFINDDKQKISNNLEIIYNALGPEILSQLGIYNFFIDNSLDKNMFALNDLKARIKGICNQKDNIITKLKKEQDLQNKFLEFFNKIPLSHNRKFDIKALIDYAKKYNYMDKDVEFIISKHNDYLVENVILMDEFLVTKKESEYPISLNNRQCLSGCKIHTPLVGSQYCYCDTMEYKSSFGNSKWDYCAEENCKK